LVSEFDAFIFISSVSLRSFLREFQDTTNAAAASALIAYVR
jgi:hypothetical protein